MYKPQMFMIVAAIVVQLVLYRVPGTSERFAEMRTLFTTVRQKNLAVGIAVCGVAAASASIPFAIRKRMT